MHASHKLYLRLYFIRRCCDVVAASFAFVALLPAMAISAFFVHRALGRPLLFAQMRMGQFGKPFKFIKLRTMSDLRDHAGVPLPDDLRTPPIGSLLRRTSLDELPSLYNLLMGDVTLVGPRPLPTTYGPLLSRAEHLRHLVKPGITGLAQIKGRSQMAWRDRFRCDIKYTARYSPIHDATILLYTIHRVFAMKNTEQMPPDGGFFASRETP